MLIYYVVFFLLLAAMIGVLLFFDIMDASHTVPGSPLILSISVCNLAIGGRMIWHLLLYCFRGRDPALCIDQEGVSIGRVPWIIGEVSLLWEEVDALSSSSSIFGKYLCIRLKNPRKFLVRFGLWKRLSLCGPAKNASVIRIQQTWLQEDISDLLQQIASRYGERLGKKLQGKRGPDQILL